MKLIISDDTMNFLTTDERQIWFLEKIEKEIRTLTHEDSEDKKKIESYLERNGGKQLLGDILNDKTLT